MKKLIILATAFVLAGAVGVAGQTFDQRVSEARRHMRAACQGVQQLSRTAPTAQSGLKETAALRKKVGYAGGFLRAEKREKAQALVKEILAARDAVLLSPPPATSNQDAYLAALAELSKSVDALAEAIRRGDDIKPVIDQLILLVERVYELAI